ncbi:MAG: LamG-like jellyroll fold domain-containing protein [Lentisphaeria bacterium]
MNNLIPRIGLSKTAVGSRQHGRALSWSRPPDISPRRSSRFSSWPAVARFIRRGVFVFAGLVSLTARADTNCYFHFNGTNYAIPTVTTTNVFAATNGTFELWFRSADTNNNRFIAGTYNEIGGYGFKASNTVSGTACSFLYVENNNGARLREVKQSSSVNIRDGSWHHLAGTWKTNGTMALWIDGGFENSNGIAKIQVTGSSLLLGNVPLYDNWNKRIKVTQAVACDIALVRLSRSVRYTNDFGSPTTLSSDTNTVALWTMEEVIGTTIYDFSDGGYDQMLIPDSNRNYPVWTANGLTNTMVFTSVPTATDITYESASIFWAVTNSTGQSATHLVRYRLNGSNNTEVAVAQEDDGQVSVTLTNLLAGRTYDYYAQSSNDFANVRLPTGILRYNRFSTELLNGIGSYLNFNGSNYAATTVLTTNVFAPTNGTFELWYRSTETNDNRYIAGTLNNTGGYCFKAYQTNNTSICSFLFVQANNVAVEVRQTSNINIRDGDWHHLAATWNNNTLALWIGGAFENSATLTTTQKVGGSLMLGNVPIYNNYTKQLILANASKCDIALARLSSSVRYTTAFASPTSLSNDGNTIGLWTMSEGSGTITDDSSDNDYDETLYPDAGNNYPTWGSSGISADIAITSGPTIFDITNESASVVWTVTNSTAQTATHRIRYWFAGSPTNSVTAGTDPGNGEVNIALTNLLAGHTYNYYVQSSNSIASATAPTGSPGYTNFSTPSWIYVGSPSYSSLSTNSVDITWSVQNDSATTVTHRVTLLSGSEGITNFFFDLSPGPAVTNVTMSVTNLSSGKTYNYKVASFVNDANGYGSNDVVGYCATNGSVFTVPTQPLITISRLHCTNALPNSMDVVWTVTNRTSNSASHLAAYLVDGGGMSDPIYATNDPGTGQVSIHLSGLQPATTYYCVAQSILDGMSNYYIPSLVMTSLSLAADTIGVRITNAPTLVSTNGYGFTLSWGFRNNTGTGVYHMVTYSPSGGYSSPARTVTAYTPAGANTVSVALSGLDPSSSYTFTAGSIPQEGTGQTSYYVITNGTFTTTNFTLPQYITIDSVTNSVVTDTMALVTWHVDKVDPDDFAFHYVVSSTNGVPTNVVNAIVTEGFEDEDGNVVAILSGLTPYTNCYYYVQSVINGASGFFRTDTQDGNFYNFMPGFAWFAPWDFGVLTNFVSALNNATPISVFLTNQFSESSRWVLSTAVTNTQEQASVLAGELNCIIGTGVSIYDSNLFSGVTLSKDTTNLLAQASQYGDFVQLNRMLLQNAYPNNISTNLMVDMLPVDTSGDTPIIAVTGAPTTNGVTDSMAWITWNVTITDTNYVASHVVVYNVGSAPASTNALMATGVQGTNGMVMALLEGLPPGSEVYYYIHSIIDPGIGHYVTDNNYGACYSFTTRSSGDNSDYSTTGNDILNWWKSVYGFNPLNSKVAYTRWIGTGPLFWDSDGDGVPDWQDAFPNDPNLSQMPGSGSQEGPTITLIEPTDAQPIQ